MIEYHPGWVAEWLCSGLQSRGRRFDSALSLQFSGPLAQVVKLVDTRDLKSLGFTAVPVRFRPWAPLNCFGVHADNSLTYVTADFLPQTPRVRCVFTQHQSLRSLVALITTPTNGSTAMIPAAASSPLFASAHDSESVDRIADQ